MTVCRELIFQGHVHRSNPYHIVQAKKGPGLPTLSSFSPSELIYCKVALLQRDKDTPYTEQQKQQHIDKSLIGKPMQSSLLHSQYQCHVEKFPVFQHSLERQQKQLFYN
uniref:Uncharacterized protein n=1 Tax=Arundo donax TaxID=35708 RepID=A0A0A9D8J0_ARUDO